MPDLRWAVMGTGRIAAGVLPRIARAAGCVVVAVASRERGRAEALARASGVFAEPARAACVYGDLAGRDDVDAVYITLPNHLHVEWCVRLLEGGKHVLCEKPLSATVAGARRAAEASRRAARLCVEGFAYLHHPQTARLVELARAGDAPGNPLGRLVRIRSHRNVRNMDPYILRTRLDAGMHGGAVMDVGCYPISAARFVVGEEPSPGAIRARAAFGRWIGDEHCGVIERRDGATIAVGRHRPGSAPAAATGWVDETCEFAWRFPSGVEFEGECSFTKGAPAGGVFLELIGERGRAHTTHPFSPDADRQPLLIESAGRRWEEVFERAGDKFEAQFARFALAARGEAEPLPTTEWSVGQASVIEGIHRAIGLELAPE